jgi:class 3 adenylate cyclase
MNALLRRLENLHLSLRWRITLPFLLLALLLGLGATYFVLRLIQETGEERLLRQLANSGQQAADSVVGIEQDLLALERLVANTEGVLPAVLNSDAEALRSQVLPIVVNAEADVVVILDQTGTSLLAIRRQPGEGAGSYETVRGEAYYADWPFVARVLGQSDPNSEKMAGLGAVQTDGRESSVLFVAGPIQTNSGRVLGSVLTGEYLDDAAEAIAAASGSNLTLYGADSGDILATSFSADQGVSNPLPAAWRQNALTDDAETPVRQIEVAGVPYREALLPFTVRQGDTVLGVLGVSLLDTAQVESPAVSQRQSQRTVRLVSAIGALGLLLIGLSGLLISHSITQPLVEIAEASKQVATGNLDIEVPERGGGEVTVVARSFNQMVRGLRQSSQGMVAIQEDLPAAKPHEWEEEATLPLAEIEQSEASILALALRPRPQAAKPVSPAKAAENARQRLEVIERVVEAHRGRLLSFDGSTGIAGFGLPPDRQPLRVSALIGSHAAVALVEELRSLDLDLRAEAGEGFLVNTVLHCGPVALADMGQRYGLSANVYGDIVNQAKELLGAAAQRQEGGVLITHNVQELLGQSATQFVFGRHGLVTLRPPGGKVEVHEIQERQVRLIDTEPKE